MSKKFDAAEVFSNAARRAVRKVGWSPKFDLEIRGAEKLEPMTSGSYGVRAGRVQLTYSADLPERLAAIQERGPSKKSRNVERGIEAVAASRVYMSAGAFKICPFSKYDYAGILDAVADGLRSVGASEVMAADFRCSLASFFIASVVSGVNAIAGPDAATFRRGWALDTIVTSAEDATLPRYAALYSNIQLRLWSNEAWLAEALRSRFPRPFDALEFETDRGVAILLDRFDMVGEEGDGIAWRDDTTCDLILDELKYRYRLWPIKAFQFAELLGPYVADNRQEPRQQSESQPGRRPGLLPQPGQGDGASPSLAAEVRRDLISGSGLPRRPTQAEEDGKAGCHLPSAPMDAFTDGFLNDPNFRRDVVRTGISRGINPLKHDFSFDSLDELYRERAAQVRIEGESEGDQHSVLDIAHMQRLELDSGIPSLSRIDWGATRFLPGGGMQLYEKALPITDETPGSNPVRGFPDLLFIADSSGSMSWDPNSGKGRYDALLGAVYSVLAFLEEEKMAPYMKFAAVNFSATTIKTGWLGYGELDRVKKLLFKHQGGGTVFDPTALDDLVRSSTGVFLCVMITDGHIGNPDTVLASVQRTLSKGNGVIWIQIGTETPLVASLREIGVSVYVIASHSELEGVCLAQARTTWGKEGRQ